MEDSSSMDWGRGGLFGDDSNTLHLLPTLLSLHQPHVRSSGIRSWKLGTYDLETWGCVMCFEEASRM